MTANLKNCILCVPPPGDVQITQNTNFDGIDFGYAISDGTYIYTLVGEAEGKPRYTWNTGVGTGDAQWAIAFKFWFIQSADQTRVAVNFSQSSILPSSGWCAAVKLFGIFCYPAFVSNDNEGNSFLAYDSLDTSRSFSYAPDNSRYEGTVDWADSYYYTPNTPGLNYIEADSDGNCLGTWTLI